jgi:hypothetical protein
LKMQEETKAPELPLGRQIRDVADHNAREPGVSDIPGGR